MKTDTDIVDFYFSIDMRDPNTGFWHEIEIVQVLKTESIVENKILFFFKKKEKTVKFKIKDARIIAHEKAAQLKHHNPLNDVRIEEFRVRDIWGKPSDLIIYQDIVWRNGRWL